MEPREARCLYCGSVACPGRLFCDGRQGRLEANVAEPVRANAVARDVPPIVPPAPGDPRRGTITERAERFHARNPAVYVFAVRITRLAKQQGHAHYGIRRVWEEMRHSYLETHGDVYKLNDHYHAWYARRIMALEPDLDGFFETRGRNDPTYWTREVRP